MQMWRHGWCPRCQRDRQSCYLLLAHPLNESHVASSGCGKYKYKYKYKCVCVCVCVVEKVCSYTTYSMWNDTKSCSNQSNDCQQIKHYVVTVFQRDLVWMRDCERPAAMILIVWCTTVCKQRHVVTFTFCSRLTALCTVVCKKDTWLHIVQCELAAYLIFSFMQLYCLLHLRRWLVCLCKILTSRRTLVLCIPRELCSCVHLYLQVWIHNSAFIFLVRFFNVQQKIDSSAFDIPPNCQ